MDKDVQQAERDRTAARRQEELDDYNLSAAGFDTTRASIHQVNKERNQQYKITEQKRKHDRALLGLARDFAEALERVGNQLGEAQTMVYEAMQQVQQMLEDAEANASRTINGRVVFRDKNGVAHAADGKPLSQDEIHSITWRKDAMTWEEYQRLTQTMDKLRQHDQRLIDIYDEVEEMRDDPTPENLERLEGYEQEIEKIADTARQVNSEISTENDASVSLEKSSQSVFVPEIPNL